MPGQTAGALDPDAPPGACLQWRAGQLPGQTSSTVRWYHLSAGPFNGGPGNCPAKPRGRAARRSRTGTFNGGPGNCPAKRRGVGGLGGLPQAFNGGPGNCPAKPRHTGYARPPSPSFNGGPGNCPAKPSHSWSRLRSVTGLQWRAGQLPGQTGGREVCDEAVEVPSMEGRAIARPNPHRLMPRRAPLRHLQWRAGQLPGQTSRCPPRRPAARRPFNGGPGNCPAKHAGAGPDAGRMTPLQWRAGQLPGQTSRSLTDVPPQTPLQWRAGQLPGQTLPHRHWFTGELLPSMEGRAIARPNRREQVVHLAHRSAFNGGPGNCPAKLSRAHNSHVLGLPPSMEGRAIARPNG